MDESVEENEPRLELSSGRLALACQVFIACCTLSISLSSHPVPRMFSLLSFWVVGVSTAAILYAWLLQRSIEEKTRNARKHWV
jgi:hypothetical protein